MIATYLLTTGIVVVAVCTGIEQWKSWILSRKNWDDVIAELQPTPTADITVIALEFLNPEQSSVTTTVESRLTSLGGLEGLRRMRANGEVLIALAAQAERWSPETTRTLVAQMRHDGAELRRAARWLSFPLLYACTGRGQASIQCAAAAYYRMIYRLLDAFRELSPKYLSSLNAAVWN